MSSTTQPTTFSDLYTDAINRVRASSSDTSTVTMMKRYINQALHDVHIQQNWPWAERQSTLTTHAPYSEGTVSIDVTSTRTTVTGSSTAWTTQTGNYGYANARAGGKILLGSSIDPLRVSTVAATSIVLESTNLYLGDTLSDADYTYFEDEYTLASDFWRMIDPRKFSDTMTIDILPRQEFYRRYGRNSTFNTPQVCTITDYGVLNDVTTAGLQRVVFHPAPDRAILIPYRYITSNLAVSSVGVPQAQLSSDSDEPIIPLRYRHVLVFYAISQWYRDRKDDQRSGEANGEYTDLVRRMAGDSTPQRDHPRFVGNRRDYLRGAAGYRRSSRYGTGTAFDEMRDW